MSILKGFCFTSNQSNANLSPEINILHLPEWKCLLSNTYAHSLLKLRLTAALTPADESVIEGGKVVKYFNNFINCSFPVSGNLTRGESYREL